MIDRRLFLGSAAGAVGLIAAGCAKSAGADSQSPATKPVGAPPPFSARNFTIAERDRRWSAVRERLRANGLAALIVPTSTHFTLNYAQYLSDAGFMLQGGVVLVADGDAYIFGAPPFPGKNPAWIANMLPPFGSFGSAASQVLGAAGISSAKVGIVGAHASKFGLNEFTAAGFFPASSFKDLIDGAPEVELVDFTPDLAEVMLVKSSEEIAAMEQAAQFCEGVHRSILAKARAGVTPFELNAHVGSLYANSMASPGVQILESAPVPFGEGTVVNTEYGVKLAGGHTQGTLSFAFSPVSDETNSLAQVAERAFEASKSAAMPGTRFGDAVKAAEAIIDEAGYWNGFPVIHSMSPIALVGRVGMAPGMYQPVRGEEIILQSGMVLSFEANARKGQKAMVKVGGTGVVTDTGVRMLNTLGNTMQVISAT